MTKKFSSISVKLERNKMAKYKPGQTSESVKNNKEAITQSLKNKAKLIKKIYSHNDIYQSLEMKGETISEAAIYSWEDKSLGLIKCSRNTAHATHNKDALKDLLTAVYQVNSRLSKGNTGKEEKTKSSNARLTQEAVDKLKEENEELRSALAEVYRAYIQALEYMREDCEVDDALRRLLLNQASVLGRERVWEIK